MGQVCDCLFRQQHHNRLDDLEKHILKYEELMEQWVVNNSCCDTSLRPYNKNKKPIYR